jgi:hypothetical protein
VDVIQPGCCLGSTRWQDSTRSRPKTATSITPRGSDAHSLYEHYNGDACRDFHLTVQPSVELAETSRYGMANFAQSNSHQGQQIYIASSVGNDATTWIAVNDGKVVLNSTKGMHAVRDPSMVRSPEGNKFFLVATDLNVDGVD